MSLINEALKKAQRARTASDPTDAPPIPGSPIVKRRQPRSAKTVVFIGGGALALVLISVGVTIYLISRPDTPPAVAAAPAPKQPAATATTPAQTSAAPAATPSTQPATPAANPSTPTTTAAVTPTISAPVTPAPKSTPAETRQTAAPTPVAAKAPASTTPPAPATAVTAPATTPPLAVAAPVPQPTSSSTTAAPTQAATPDERVVAFVEAVRVAGIRSSGSDSRVLMNERVYRVNDIVDRNLGVRLVKVAVDSLTFADTNGVTYVKHF